MKEPTNASAGQSETVKMALPAGADRFVVSGLALAFLPTAATAETEGDANIWATLVPGSLSRSGATFDLSGEPVDGSQILVATFYEMPPAAANEMT